MAQRLEGANQLNEVIFQDPIDSFPHRDNYEKVTQGIAAHANSIEALENGGTPPGVSSAEVVAARDEAAGECPTSEPRYASSERQKLYGIWKYMMHFVVDLQGDLFEDISHGVVGNSSQVDNGVELLEH